MPDLGARNEMIVLQTIRTAREGISQTEITDRSSLSRQTVSLITRRLVERGFVRAHGTRPQGRGKPRTILRVAPLAQLSAGVHLDPAGVSVVVVDLLAQVLSRRTLDPPGDDPAGDVQRIAGALAEMRAEVSTRGTDGEAGRARPPLLLHGIGVASPGGVDSARGVLVNPPWFPAWWGFPLVEVLGRTAGLPVVLDKDTNAALTAENWSRTTTVDETVLFVYVGAGIGSAVSSRGELHRGATTQAGEIGHLPTGLDAAACSCGRHSCLSLHTDVQTMLDHFRGQGVHAAPAGSSMLERLRVLVEAAADGATVAAALVAGHGAALGEALRTLIGVHDPDRVIIGGPYWGLLSTLTLPQVRERALRSDARGRRVEIVSSQLGDEGGAVGAATLLLEKQLSPARR